MKQTISVHDFRDAFQRIRPDYFSYDGLGILFDYLEELEADTGEETELDVIAICCDWEESDAETIADYYELSDQDVADMRQSLQSFTDEVADWLRDQTQVAGITYDDQIVYLSF